LKELHKLYLKALRCFAQWQRWRRKQPQNRVLRQAVRDGRGCRVGRIVVGPWPEPRLCPVFCLRQQVVGHFAENGQMVRKGIVAERVSFDDHGIPTAYRAARMPAPSAEAVPTLPLSPEAIGRLLAEAEAFFAES